MERSGTARQPQLLGQKKDKFWLTVGLCALTAALFFLPFYIIDGGFFHYAGDFNSQQISFYRYMNGFIKGAGYPDSAFTSVHNTFSWATDLGSGVMNAYSFYLYGSPFFWFSLLFPQGWLPYLMVPLLDYGFAAYAAVPLPAMEDRPLLIKVKGSAEESVPLDYTALPETLLMPKENAAALTAQLDLPQELEAPVQLGQTVGSVRILSGETQLGEYEVRAAADAEKMDFGTAFGLLWDALTGCES